MAADVGMLTGFNHNIKHDGRIFHIQTEDSGVKAPHIITHVFVGGNIIATKKTSYSDVLSTPNLDDVVRRLMEEQHKGMLRNLIHGQYNQAASDSLGGVAPAAEAPAPPTAPPPPAAVPVAPLPLTPTAPSPPAAASLAATPPAAEPPVSLEDMDTVPAATLPRRPTRAPLPVDMPASVPPPRSIWDLPGSAPETADTPPDFPGAHPPEVLAARELTEAPVEKPSPHDTIFGEDLLDEKSLDEVILSYLADDLDL